MPPAVRVAVALPGGRELVLRITPGFAGEAAEAVLRWLRQGAYAGVPFHASGVWQGVAIGREVDCEGLLPGPPAEVERLPVFPGSACLFQSSEDSRKAQLGIYMGEGPSPQGEFKACWPVGAVADPTGLGLLLDLARSGQLPDAGAPWLSTCRDLDGEEAEQSQRLHAHLAPWEPMAEEQLQSLHPFPLDLFEPLGNRVWHPRTWMLCFQPEVLPVLGAIWEHTCTPPLPWGHHFYAQLFLRRAAGLEGDVVELGVAKGGTSIFLARLAQLSGKRFVCVDSFQGLPAPNAAVDNPYFVQGDFGPKEGIDMLKRFQALAESHGINGSMTVIKSFFCDVEALPSGKICFAHLDSDLYDSIRQSLALVYDKLVPGGLIIIDDFFHHAQGPARAVSTFFRESGGKPPVLHPIPPYAVAIQKGRDISDPALRGAKCAPDGNFYSFEWLRESDGFLACAEAGRARLLAELRRDPGGPPAPGLLRCLGNAERFATFVRGSAADAPCSRSSEVLEYLSCLDLWMDTFSQSEYTDDPYLV